MEERKNEFECVINGIVCNLKGGMQIMKDNLDNNKFALWINATYGIEILDVWDFQEYIVHNNFIIPPYWNTGMAHPDSDLYRRQQAVARMRRHSPKCPTCQSENVSKIDDFERTASVGLFGLFSDKINKSFKCKSCGYTW